MKTPRKRLLFTILALLSVVMILPLFHIDAPDREASDSVAEVPPDGFRLSIITDIDHCPSRAPVSDEMLDAFLSDAKDRRADLIVSLGDNASHRLGNCSDTADTDATHIADRLRSAGIPAHFVLGDHDIASKTASYQAWISTIGRDRPFYSFDTEGVHVIILDTVAGGEPLVDDCRQSPGCAEALAGREQARIRLEKTANGDASPDGPMTLAELRDAYKESIDRYQRELEIIHDVRNASHRDRGMVLDRELEWLATDLDTTESERILVLSDHPLFPFESDRKAYDIENGVLVREILETAASGEKRIVAISGEAHLWHDETRNGIDYHIVDEFRKAGGSWALFSWEEASGPALERILTEPETDSAS